MTSEIKNLNEFIWALFYNYPKAAKEDDTRAQDIFFKKYSIGLAEFKNNGNIDYDKLLELCLRENPHVEFPPGVQLIKELTRKAVRNHYVSDKLQSFCYRQNGRMYELAYPKREEEKYLTALRQIQASAEKFWFGPACQEP